MTYREAIRYLDSFVNYEKRPAYPYKGSFKLERVRDFLKSIGDPQADLSCIHVAGTKGKGSVCAFTAFILRAAGYKVGLYTSPHLSDARERIRVLRPQATDYRPRTADSFEGMIPQPELARIVARLKPAIEKYCRRSEYGALSFFEVYTVLAFIYFKAQKVDLAVLETGLGGRLDATNVIQPLVCGITSISYDHTKQLGNTLAEIAGEKSGIIKARSAKRETRNKECKAQRLTVVTAPQEKEALAVIRNKCKKTKARLFMVGKEIVFHKTRSGLGSQGFCLAGLLGEYPDLRIRLLGRHQLINAALAVALVEDLALCRRIKISPEQIKRGLYDTAWPARCEIIPGPVPVILDGAHNPASARSLKETLIENFGRRKTIIILGISRDKDTAGICRELSALSKNFILTQAKNPRAADPAKLGLVLSGIAKDARITFARGIKEALLKAAKKASANGLVVVTGSLFLAGEARELLVKDPKALFS